VVTAHVRLLDEPAEVVGEEDELPVGALTAPGLDGDAVLGVAGEAARRIIDDDDRGLVGLDPDQRLVEGLVVLLGDGVEATATVARPELHPVDAQGFAGRLHVGRLSGAPDEAAPAVFDRGDQLFQTRPDLHKTGRRADHQLEVDALLRLERGEHEGLVQIQNQSLHLTSRPVGVRSGGSIRERMGTKPLSVAL